MARFILGLVVGAALASTAAVLIVDAYAPMSVPEVEVRLRAMRTTSDMATARSQNGWPDSLSAFVVEHQLDDAVCEMISGATNDLLSDLLHFHFPNPDLNRLMVRRETDTVELCLAFAVLDKWAQGDPHVWFGVAGVEGSELVVRAFPRWAATQKVPPTPFEPRHMSDRLGMTWSVGRIHWDALPGGRAAWQPLADRYDLYVPRPPPLEER